MMRRLFLLLSFLFFSGSLLFAQDDLSKQQQSYEQNKRDLKVVKAYYEALLGAKKKNEAVAVLKEYMSRCPVVQIEDKDTYMLLSDLLFKDPYNNEFEYAAYAYKKFVWDREDAPQAVGREAMLKSVFRGMGSGTSKGDEVDKRYEAYNIMTKTLGREIDNQCTPSYRKAEYKLPVFDALKVDRLEYIAQKIGGLDVVLLKIANARAIDKGDYATVIHNMEVFTSIGSRDVMGNYFTSVMIYISPLIKDNALVKEALKCIEKLGCDDYSSVAYRYYFLADDKVNGEKYKKKYEDAEAIKMERFGDLFKALDK